MIPNVEEFFYLQNQIIALREKVNQIEMDIMEIIGKNLSSTQIGELGENNPASDPKKQSNN